MSGGDGTLYKHIWKYFVCWGLAGEQGENMIWHILFSHHVLKAEQLRKKWEEEEEERLKQISVPAEPKSKTLKFDILLIFALVLPDYWAFSFWFLF